MNYKIESAREDLQKEVIQRISLITEEYNLDKRTDLAAREDDSNLKNSMFVSVDFSALRKEVIPRHLSALNQSSSTPTTESPDNSQDIDLENRPWT